jgi:hypothetical protein
MLVCYNISAGVVNGQSTQLLSRRTTIASLVGLNAAQPTFVCIRLGSRRPSGGIRWLYNPVPTLGYDNAHAVKPPKKFKFAGRRLPCDHRHRTSSDRGVPYAFESAYRLLVDFFAEVDRAIKEAQQ